MFRDRNTLGARSIILSASAGLLLTIFGVGTGRSQDAAENSLSEVVIKYISRAFPVDYFPPDALVEGRSYRAVSETYLVPNYVLGDDAFLQSLSVMEVVPPLEGPIPTSGNGDTIAELLAQLRSDVEFSSRAPSEEEKAEFEAARSLLFQPGSDEPSQTYGVYLDFERKYKEDVEKLNAETNAASRIVIQTRLANLEREWTVFGSRVQVDAAKRVLAELQVESAEPLFNQWIEKVDAYKSPVVSDLNGSFSNADWARISVSSSEVAKLKPRLRTDGSNIPLPGLSRLSFDVAIVPIKRDILDQLFLLNTTWRSKSGYVVSDGTTSPDSEGELVPRFVSHLVVVKNLEILFSEKMDAIAIKRLAKAKEARISNVVIKTNGTGAPSYQERAIAVSSPVIFGAAIGNLTKIPNPAIGRSWGNQ